MEYEECSINSTVANHLGIGYILEILSTPGFLVECRSPPRCRSGVSSGCAVFVLSSEQDPEPRTKYSVFECISWGRCLGIVVEHHDISRCQSRYCCSRYKHSVS